MSAPAPTSPDRPMPAPPSHPRSLARSLVRFGALGGVSFALNLGITIALHEQFGAPEELAFAIALATVLVVNFLACRFFVFDARHGHAGRQLTAFVLASFAFRGLEWLAFLVVHTWLGAPYVWAIAGILVVSMGVKFVFYRSVVFRAPSPAGADRAPEGRPR